MAKKANDIVPTMLRMREEMRKRLERESKRNKRSLNAEMVLRLEQSFVKDSVGLRDGAFLDVLAAAVPKNQGTDGQPQIDTAELAKRFADVLQPRLSRFSDSNVGRYLEMSLQNVPQKKPPKPPTEKDE